MTDRRGWGISRTMILVSQIPIQLYAIFWSYSNGAWPLTILAAGAMIFCAGVMVKTIRAAISG